MSFKLLDSLTEHGFSFIDTADVYAIWVPGQEGGGSERIIGKWMKERRSRERMIVATKCGMEMGPGKKGLSKKYILEAIDASLGRLQTDYVDLYQAHKDDPEVPLEETLDAFAILLKAGKARAIGASNYSAPRLAEALRLSERHGLPRFESLQPEYNLVEREAYETTLQPLCRHHHLGVMPYFSLAAGFLTGKYRSEADLAKSPRGKRVQGYLNPRGMRVLAALDQVSARHGATLAQVAIAWLLSNPTITAPIASATSIEQLEGLIAAMQLKLEPTDVAELNEASAFGAA
jgi:aryl-alcohol dehydrogenase-like predicted oxidoreductase